jgi:hypothetical protein
LKSTRITPTQSFFQLIHVFLSDAKDASDHLRSASGVASTTAGDFASRWSAETVRAVSSPHPRLWNMTLTKAFFLTSSGMTLNDSADLSKR